MVAAERRELVRNRLIESRLTPNAIAAPWPSSIQPRVSRYA